MLFDASGRPLPPPEAPPPVPEWWLDLQRSRLTGEADELRAGARELRDHAAAIAPVVLRLRDFDRPDVWQGAVADRYRARLAEVMRRLGHPLSGVGAGLLDAAVRLEARAAALEREASLVGVAPAPPAVPPPTWPYLGGD